MKFCPYKRAARLRTLLAATCIVASASACAAQQVSDSAAPVANPPAVEKPDKPRTPDTSNDKVDHRIMGVLPNYRTANPMDVYEPLTPKQKFTIAAKDSFDWPIFALSAVFAGMYQLENQNPSFGQGVKGYAHRYWTSVIDQSFGNFMTEGLMPTLLREDPRYFRKVKGSTKSRLGYALTRVLVTHTDAGGTRFNFSEVIGNGIMATVGNAYYPDSRGVGNTIERLGLQIGTDSVSNVLKEFWPDVKRRAFHRH